MQYTVPTDMNFTQLANVVGVNEQTLRAMNPGSGELIRGQVINLPYSSPFDADFEVPAPEKRERESLFNQNLGLEPDMEQWVEDMTSYNSAPVEPETQLDIQKEYPDLKLELPEVEVDQLDTQEDPLMANQLDTQDEAQEMFLDYMARVEGTKRHQGAEGGDADTHGYGLKESTRKELGIEMGDPRSMASKAYSSFYNKAKESIKGLDKMDVGAKLFATSAVWNTGDVWGSVKALAEANEFDSSKAKNWLANTRAGGKYLPGLGNRRAQDYNVLAEARGWPKVMQASYSPTSATYKFSDGTEEVVEQPLEPTKQQTYTF